MKLLLLFGILLIAPLMSLAQAHEIIAAEYFFDTDPGPGNGVPMAVVPSDTVVLDGEISTAGLSVGTHSLNVRVKREDNRWGEPTRCEIRIGIGTTFQDAEVFFDTDPGLGNGLPVAISVSGVIDELAFDVPDIGRGFHSLNLRCYSGGTWSMPTSRTLRLGSALIDAAEIYFDLDPGEGNGIPVDVETGLDVAANDSTVPVAAAGTGTHACYMRFRGGGVWSFPKFKTLRIGDAVLSGANRITGGEFFFDTDPGVGNGCALHAEDGAFDEGTEAMQRFVEADLSLGQHTVGLRAKDAGDRWYNTVRDTFNVIEYHLATCYASDLPPANVLLTWTKFPEALEYRIHYDSLSTGTYTNYISVAPPDTSVQLPATQSKLFYKVTALQVAPDPCDGRSDSYQPTQIISHKGR